MQMRSMHVLLKDAEKKWRTEVKRDLPLWGNMQVITSGKQEKGRDWSFSTDLRRTFALIFNDEALQRKFTDQVPKYWTGDPEELARDTQHYLLYHELYHPIEAPFSVSGDPNDNKSIHQAIRSGIVFAEPTLSPLEQILKVQASQNGVKDFILDNRFAIDNAVRGYVRNDIIPVWDFLELLDAPARTNFYTATRFLYGVLYGPQSTHVFFAEKAQDKGVEIAGKALGALLGEKVDLPQPLSLLKKVRAALKGTPEEEVHERMKAYVSSVRFVFAGKDRYAGIERMMKVLGPYVTSDMPQVRPDQQGEGSGTSPQSILQDLLDGMTPQEQQAFVQQLTQQIESGDPRGRQFGMGAANSANAYSPTKDDIQALELTALNEFYKRAHPEVRVVGGQQVGESVVVGKKQSFTLANSTVISADQLSKLNLTHIARFQQRTRLPVLIPLDNGQYRLNEYSLREREVKDIVYADESLDVPDEVEFYLDSSGSMYRDVANLGFNDGSSWDMLSHVVYGFVDALRQGGKAVSKKSSIRIHNFADRQVTSPLISVDEFWSGRPDVLKVLFKPENGYSVEDIDIQPIRDGKRRVYVVATDGNLVISGRTQRESDKMRQLAQTPNTDVVLFEIGGTYDLGKAVRNDPNIHYYAVHNKEEMLRNGLEVLLAK